MRIKKRIFFLMSHCSHQNCTFPTARKLVSRSYNVYYCGPSLGVDGDNLARNATAQGFKFAQLDLYNRSDDSAVSAIHQTVYKEAIRLENFFYHLKDGTLYRKFFETWAPDLLIVDIHFMALVMPFFYFRIPILLASTKIGTDKDRNVPPLNSSIVPDPDDYHNKAIENAWLSVHEKKQKLIAYHQFLREVARRYHFDFDRYFYLEKSIVPFGFRLPELIFWDSKFDFKRSSQGLANKYYLGNQIDLKRLEDLHHVRENKHQHNIVCVSLGSRWGKDSDNRFNLLNKILIAASGFKSCHFFIAGSIRCQELEESHSLSNVTLLEVIPQIHLLAKSILMITHAGGNSIKECIRFGVPILCYPFDNDQLGNAARVVYHKIGLRGNHKIDSPKLIEEKISFLLESKDVHHEIQKFKIRSIEAERSTHDVQIIERFI